MSPCFGGSNVRQLRITQLRPASPCDIGGNGFISSKRIYPEQRHIGILTGERRDCQSTCARFDILEELFWKRVRKTNALPVCFKLLEDVFFSNDRMKRRHRIGTKMLTDEFRCIDTGEDRSLSGAALGQPCYAERRVGGHKVCMFCRNAPATQVGQFSIKQRFPMRKVCAKERVDFGISFPESNTIEE